jgi:hypothetical protein
MASSHRGPTGPSDPAHRSPSTDAAPRDDGLPLGLVADLEPAVMAVIER